jgi:16S rRNA (guanine1516-N2)-methyltransferase
LTNLTIHIQDQKYLAEAERWAVKLSLPLISVGNTIANVNSSPHSVNGADNSPDKPLDESKSIGSHVSMNSAEAALDAAAASSEDALHLLVGDRGLSLCQGSLEVRGDFTRMLPRLRSSNLQREFLVKAGKFRNLTCPTALDATAGLGEDSILLAAAGFRVHLYEYNPIIAALLEDAMKRAEEIPELAEAVSRMTLHTGDSIQAMHNLPDAIGMIPDMVLLDPMFPERHKSALVKKKFQLLQQLEAPCSTEEELLQAALQTGTRKVIIKRPLKGPYLAGKKPSYSISGKAIRYDCIVIPRIE